MKFEIFDIQAKSICKRPITACKKYCLAAGATQGNIAYTQTVTSKRRERHDNNKQTTKNKKK